MPDHEVVTARIAAAMRDVIADAVLTNEKIARGFGINVVDLQTFGMIMQSTTMLTPGEISARTGLPTSTTTRVLDRLEKTGFINRRPDDQDRRRIVIELTSRQLATPDGQNPYAGVLEGLRMLHSGFTGDELEVVARYLEAMAAGGR